MDQVSFSFEGRIPGLEKEQFFSELRQFAESQKWLPRIIDEVQLLLEEWLTNVFTYGAHGEHPPEARVVITLRENLARIEIADNGIAFEPTKHPAPDLKLPPEERPIGGLGIFMMRNLSQSMRYHRAGDWNRLVIEKNLAAPSLAGKKEAPQS